MRSISALRYVVVTGLPASGKSTLARRVAPLLELPVIDKDDDLEALFDERGTGSADHRRELSRESDRQFMARALAAGRGLLVSFWHLTGMPEDSGTPTDWLRELPGAPIQLWCRCPAQEALRRFRRRTRHAGHLDRARDEGELIAQLEMLSRLEPLSHGTPIEVRTDPEPDVRGVAEKIRRVAAARGRSAPRDARRHR